MEYPLVPFSSGAPDKIGDRGPTLSASLDPPTHQAAELRFATSGTTRDQCWTMIGERTRTRLLELSGIVYGWYANEDTSSPDHRPYAIAFGDQGLSIAEPRLNTEHRPVYVISAFQCDPGSLGWMRIDDRPQPAGARPAGVQPVSALTAPHIGLSTKDKGVLGNLPTRAQEWLQAPFTATQPVRRCNWYYEGTNHYLPVFIIWLAGAHAVTVATGTKLVPAGHNDTTAHWELTCYRSTVRRRIGC